MEIWERDPVATRKNGAEPVVTAQRDGLASFCIRESFIAWLTWNVGRRKPVLIEHQKLAVRYWEKRRLILNLLLLTQSWVGWSISNAFNAGIDDIPGARITDPGVLWQFVKIFTGLNIVFSMGYVAEFFSQSSSPRKYWPDPFRMLLMVSLCLVCMWGLGARATNIAQQTAYTKAGVFGYGEKKEANQASEPTAPRGRGSP
jgi:hypothetical protein